ncbi:hypothetical protein CWI42_050300 [Ordospora colligata]|uniref:Exocyst complex component EXOC2/Sec5 N-terminal domain-containing protein n=1 Tax=Ordospora colligata OC4 TaxID=1354746 RepID=A0A0B2UKR6_9MICR|nr:uncharacterized protein M896_050330 [Ordospora colligata OC4]KHN69627.1 hypothetical protein M896_050330 [Ordospora colligata OC4]TBU15746.1 hypothetical protein CWI41_050320 [Ordospora colligata]TBU15874.1 hypothetical protein CWI40_050340 [Ordospora colligata]TBU18768.1 hypothetical protein CWI42_050300 [Ordospora colligata]
MGSIQEPGTGQAFNAVNVINKTYAESTEYDLNDSLVFLIGSINKTRARNKQLVKQHFGKFVQCRSVLEDVWTNIKQKRYDKEFTTELENNIKVVRNKFNQITSNVLEDSKSEINRHRKEYYMNKYSDLFSIKATLQKNLNNPERFVDVYENARGIYEHLKGSEYVQIIWGSIHDERCEFLENIYRRIQRPRCTFQEASYYFRLYFRICKNETEHKIMNTLLVNFKENSINALEMFALDDTLCADEITKQYLSLMNKVDEEIQIQGTNHYFYCMGCIMHEKLLLFTKICIKRLIDNIKVAKLHPGSQSVYFSHLKRVKMGFIDNELERCTISISDLTSLEHALEDLKETYMILIEIASKEEQSYIRERTLKLLGSYYEKMKLEDFSDIEHAIKIIHSMAPLIGKPGSKDIKNLNAMIGGYINDHSSKVVKRIEAMIAKQDNDILILMEVTRVIEEIPLEYERIIKQIKPLVESIPVVAYYLSKIFKAEHQQMLSNDVRERIDEIRYQFGFLLDI